MLSNKIYTGDSMMVLRTFDDDSINSIVTDPPYEMGLLNQAWDKTGIANNPVFWREAFRVLKPGGYLLCFSGARTYHHTAMAIENAGFDIRDMVEWVYGSGFPKSVDLGKHDPDLTGFGTALKPAHEPIVMARKPLSEPNIVTNVNKHNSGALNISGSRIGSDIITTNGRGRMTGSTPIVPQNPDYKGGMRVGRFPANLIISDDPAVIDCFPPDKSKFFKSIIYTAKAGTKERSAESNNHPTVKPLELMRYLVKLVTLPGGIVLDPFCGSGSTCIAAKLEGFRFVGIEINPDYADTARRRVA